MSRRVQVAAMNHASALAASTAGAFLALSPASRAQLLTALVFQLLTTRPFQPSPGSSAQG